MSRAAIRRVLSELREKEQVECLGTGRWARWRKIQRALNTFTQSLEVRREQSHFEVSPEIVLDIIAQAREGLTSKGIRVRQTLLRKFVDKVEMGNKGGRLWYTFPLAETMPDLTLLYLVPPKGFEPLSRA